MSDDRVTAGLTGSAGYPNTPAGPSGGLSATTAGNGEAPDDHKQCRKCLKVLPIDAFWRNRKIQGGFARVCKDCLRAVRAAHRDQALALVATGVKTCARCGTEKPLEAFHANWKRLDGFHVMCKPCTSEHEEEQERQNREAIEAALRAIGYRGRSNLPTPARPDCCTGHYSDGQWQHDRACPMGRVRPRQAAIN